MEGIFTRKKFNIGLFLLFLGGLFLIGMYFFLNITDTNTAKESIVILVVGIFICLLIIPCWLINAGAYLRIDEDSIKAKYHWFGKIDCKLSDVDFVLAQMNTLTIQLKNGKRHTITGIQNPWALSSAIREKLCFETPEHTEALIKRIRELKSDKKQGTLYVCLGSAFIFINLFIAIYLTGGRDLHEFYNSDWIILAGMGLMELAIIIATFCFANRVGKSHLPIEKLEYTVRRSVIENTPLQPGHIIAVYADADYTIRITVFGYPHQDEMYYAAQTIDAEYNLERVSMSDIYDHQEEPPVNLSELIDITERCLP